MVLERWEEVVESKTKTRDEERKLNRQLRVQPGHPDIGAGHLQANRPKLGHPAIGGGSPATQQYQNGSP